MSAEAWANYIDAAYEATAHDHDADAERAERDQLRREAAADAKEQRDTGWDAAGERAAAEQEESA